MTDELDRLAADAKALAERGVGTDLALRSDSAEEAREQLEAVREEVARQERAVRAEVIRKQRELEAHAAKIKADLERMRSEAEAALAPFRKMVAQLEEGLWTVDLYLGTREQILTLRDGEAAPVDTPITMRQLVLAMDEECAVAAEEGGIDAINVERGDFDQWLLEDPAHLDQVLPEPKGVVALVPRWQAGKDYDNPWMNAEIGQRNKQTYFLVRNGEQLYRIWTDFRVGRTLLPTREEYADLFWREETNWEEGGRKKVAIRPGTREWEDAEESADARQRHYMRVALIFEGLIHRTTVWHPVHPDVSFLDESAHEKGLVRFIMDAEEDRLLGSGREPWEDYVTRLQAKLRPGMRVILDSAAAHQEGWRLRESGQWHNPRIHPNGAEDPPSGELMTLEKNDAGQLVVRYKRTEEIYDPKLWVPSKTRPGWGHYGGYKVPKVRASFEVRVGDRFVLPYDLMEEEELRTYLRARLDRHHYIRMFPIIHSALAAKKKEREEEAPFRVMLTGVLARENGGTVADAEKRLPDLINWYKLANRHHRALRDDDAHAVRMIVAEDARRLKAKTGDGRIVDELLYVYEDAMLIARQRGSGKYVILEPMRDGDEVYCRRVLYGVRTGPTEDADWWKPEPHVVSRWQVLWSTERWESWNVGAKVDEYLTGPEEARLVEEIVRRGPRDARRKKKAEPRKPPVRYLSVTLRKGELAGWYADPEDDHYPARADDWRWRRRKKDGSVELYEDYWRGGGTSIAEFKKGRLPALRNGARWIDERAVSELEARLRAKKARRERERARQAEVSPYVREIEEQRRERGRAAHLAAFVERFEHAELYEGHIKAHPAERYEHEYLEGLSAALRAALDAGEVLEGRTLGEVWPEAPEEDRGLLFAAEEIVDAEDEELLEEPEGDWIEADADEDYLALPAGEEEE